MKESSIRMGDLLESPHVAPFLSSLIVIVDLIILILFFSHFFFFVICFLINFLAYFSHHFVASLIFKQLFPLTDEKKSKDY